MAGADLPLVDAHTVLVTAGPNAVWQALLRTVDHAFSGAAAERYARIVGRTDLVDSGPRPLAEGSTIPGFHVGDRDAGVRARARGPPPLLDLPPLPEPERSRSAVRECPQAPIGVAVLRAPRGDQAYRTDKALEQTDVSSSVAVCTGDVVDTSTRPLEQEMSCVCAFTMRCLTLDTHAVTRALVLAEQPIPDSNSSPP